MVGLANKSNIIKTQTWEIKVDDKSIASALQHELGGMNENTIVPLLEKACNELIPDLDVVRLNKMELDLGQVSYEQFHSELPEKVYDTFHKALAKALSGPTSDAAAGVDVISASGSQLNLLRYFLNTGTLPWWASEQNDIDLDMIVEEALVSDYRQLQAIIKKGISSLYFRRRLASYFSLKSLFSVIDMMDPNQSETIEVLYKECQTKTNGHSGSKAEWSKEATFWFNIFTCFNEHQENVDEQKLIMYASVSRNPNKDHKKTLDHKKEQKPENQTYTIREVNLLFDFLQTGVLPKDSGIEITGLNILLDNCLHQLKEPTLEAIEKGIQASIFRKRLVDHFASKQLFLIIEILIPRFQKIFDGQFEKWKTALDHRVSQESSLGLDKMLCEIFFEFLSQNKKIRSLEGLIDYMERYTEYEVQQVTFSKETEETEETEETDLAEQDETLVSSMLTSLTAFLKKGILSYGNAYQGHSNPDHLLKALINEPDEKVVNFFKKVFSDQQLRKRLIQHFSPEMVLSLVNVIYSKSGIPVNKVYKELVKSSQSQKTTKYRSEFKLFVLNKITEHLAGAVKTFSPSETFEALKQEIEKLWSKAEKAMDKTTVEDQQFHEDNLTVFIHFLNTGKAPWWTVDVSDESLFVIFRELLTDPSQETYNYLQQAKKHKLFSKRLVEACPQDITFLIIQALKKNQPSDQFVLIKELAQCMENKKEPPIFKSLPASFFQTEYFVWLQNQSSSSTTLALLEHLLKAISAVLNLSHQEVTIGMIEWMSSIDNSMFATFREMLDATSNLSNDLDSGRLTPKHEDQIRDKLRAAKESAKKRLPNHQLNNQEENTVNPKDLNIESSNQSKKDLKEEKKESEVEVEIQECYIQNSGLVILWPYLTKLFELMDLVRNNQFDNEEKKYRAAHALQYLALGEQEGLEYNYPLNKLMCGLDIGEPIPMDVVLTQQEMDGCEELLEGVIQNWEALKGTSVAGLRGSFLKREGKLIRKGEDWLLKVEQKGYDILMDKLPWSISMVKLPWNKELIHVEW
ncbi:contractile injection system tape measure protein [Reichenbachiella sp.]|uniref:contractile injection system tape measure protein n=1 Tax=Reichenbachiella sp. TaxID=2184521 RepID=UPI00329A5F40